MKLQKNTTKKVSPKKPLQKKKARGRPIGNSVAKTYKKANLNTKALSKKRVRPKYVPSAKEDSLATKYSKIRLIKALFDNFGLITPACLAAGLARSTYYDYIKSDPEFKAEAELTMAEASEMALDLTEQKLFELVNDKEPSAVYFHLKCKGKKRGYVEKQIIGIEQEQEQVVTDEEKAALADYLDNLRTDGK